MAVLQRIFPLSSAHLREDKNCDSDVTFRDVINLFETQPCRKIVIVGPDTADKTSLAFQAAVTAASTGINVTHICTHPLKRLPAPVHGMPSPEPGTMKNVDFLYLEESSELIAWLASVHTKPRLPGLIIIEDVLTYACQLSDSQVERSLARLCATIQDSASWISLKNGTSGCSVLMTAPSRIMSLAPVLHQFNFKTADYHGPGTDQLSELFFREGSDSVSIKFRRHKESLVLAEVTSSTSGTKKTVAT